MRRTLWILFAVVILWAAPVKAADFFFKDGDVVVMIGDSITEQHLYSNYVEMWTVLRFPAWKLTFRNTGIGGDTSTGGNSRFQRDVLAHKPTALTVDFGMNDGGYGGFNQGRYRPYMNGLQGMANQAKAAKIRVAWVTPQPLDTGDPGPTALTGYNQTLERFSAGVKEIAEKNGGLFVDQFHPYLAVLDRARSQAPDHYNRITGGDAVHPGPPGQALMAASILKGLNFPSLVVSVAIDANKKSVTASQNCKVGEVTEKDGSLAFEQLDEALPFFPPEATGILKFSPILEELLEELNRYLLKITGLPEGQFEIRLGGQKVAQYSADQLGKGVNLAAAVLENGPVKEQVVAVKTAVEKKNKFFHDRIFRGIVLAPVPDWLNLTRQELEQRRQAGVAERMTALREYDAQIRQALERKPHRVEVVPVKK